jgi:hypothetical protein
MPSSLHEALIEMLRQNPSFATELLRLAVGPDVPSYQQIRLESGEFTDVSPVQYRADAVVVLTAGGKPVLGVVVEVQLSRDPDKRWSWPVYLTTLRARLHCPTMLLVICMDAAIAGWCSASIELGHPGWVLSPLVLGPEEFPVVTDPGEASRAPELAALSAIAHGGRADRVAVLEAFASAVSAIDEDRATLYADVVLSVLPEAARRHLEAMLRSRTYEYRSDFARGYFSQGEARGEAKGEADALLAVLDVRGIGVPEDVRARVVGCTDVGQLRTWVRRAATASSIDEVFA